MLSIIYLGVTKGEKTHGVQLLVVLLWLGEELCRQIDEKELFLDSMEGGAGGSAAWWR
jgi:hypothetical protein